MAGPAPPNYSTSLARIPLILRSNSCPPRASSEKPNWMAIGLKSRPNGETITAQSTLICDSNRLGYGGSVLMGEFFCLVFVRHPQSHKEGTAGSDSGEWKMERAPLARTATIAAAIKYVEKMRDESKDSVIRRNADKTLAALKRLTPGCGNASAC